MPRVLIIDCFDSFTFNIFHYLDEISSGDCDVVRYDVLDVDNIFQYSHIVFSPGPGLPSEYPKLNEVMAGLNPGVSVLGVCLGLQSIVQYFGGNLTRLEKVLHGRQSKVEVSANNTLFSSFPAEINVGHYHSWVASDEDFPETALCITSRSELGHIMSIEHRSLPIYGVQFHPESIMTDGGKKMFKNWLNATRSS